MAPRVLPPVSPFKFFGEQAYRPVPLFEVDDVHSARRELEAAGVEAVGSTEHNSRWEWIHVRAPDGNLCEFASPLSRLEEEPTAPQPAASFGSRRPRRMVS